MGGGEHSTLPFENLLLEAKIIISHKFTGIFLKGRISHNSQLPILEAKSFLSVSGLPLDSYASTQLMGGSCGSNSIIFMIRSSYNEQVFGDC